MKIFLQRFLDAVYVLAHRAKTFLKINTYHQQWLKDLPTQSNFYFLLCFSAALCFFSFYFPGKIDLYAYGVYLPAVEAVMHGFTPYRDFIYLGGPLSLYIPIAMTKVFGLHLSMMILYFCIGSLLMLGGCLLIAKYAYKTRGAYFLFSFILIVQTFFNLSESFPYVFSLLAGFCIIKYFKGNYNIKWIFIAGVLTALTFLTSLEDGILLFLGIIFGLFLAGILKGVYKKAAEDAIKAYLKGAGIVLILYFLYLIFSGALAGFIDVLGSVFVHKVGAVFQGDYLRHPTRFIFFLGLFFLFYFLERLYEFYLKEEKSSLIKKKIIAVLLFISVGFSSIWALGALYQKIVYSIKDTRVLQIRRAKGVVVPIDQAREIETLVMMIQKSISKKDKIFIYPEGGAFYFFMERPFYGRFPMAISSWFHEKWHKELMINLKNDPPAYIILPKVFSSKYDQAYLLEENNLKKFNELMWFISEQYIRKGTTLQSVIYALKKYNL